VFCVERNGGGFLTVKEKGKRHTMNVSVCLLLYVCFFSGEGGGFSRKQISDIIKHRIPGGSGQGKRVQNER